jgi:hypothetical protein
MSSDCPITLKALSANERLSEETLCYSATLYWHGRKIGAVQNHGHGGCTFFRPDPKASKADIDAATAHAATHTWDFNGTTEPYELVDLADEIASAKVDEAANRRHLKRELKKATVIVLTDGAARSVVSVKRAFAPAFVPAIHARYAGRSPVILNELEFEAAFKLFVEVCREEPL